MNYDIIKNINIKNSKKKQITKTHGELQLSSDRHEPPLLITQQMVNVYSIRTKCQMHKPIWFPDKKCDKKFVEAVICQY